MPAEPHDPQLDERLERFRRLLLELGGPVNALDRGREGLEELWEFVLSRRPRWLGDSSEEKLRAAGPLPSWFGRGRSTDHTAFSLGPELLQLADGLAAQATRIIVADEPEAEWFVEKDPWYAAKLPQLRLPDRPPGPVDVQIAGFVYRGTEPPPTSFVTHDYIPADPMRLVDDFREFGDTRPRSYSFQTAKEARELLERVREEHGSGVERFLKDTRAEGGPIEELEFSAESLVPLWQWLIAQPLPDPHVPDREMRRSGPPWWYGYSGLLVGQLLGPRMSWIATGAAHYFAAVAFRLFPETSWTLGPDPIGADYRAPLLSVAAEGVMVGELEVYDRVPRWITWAHEGDERTTGGDTLLKHVRQWEERLRDPPPPPRVEPDFGVEWLSADPDGITAIVGFSDEAAHLKSARVDRMVRLLAASDGIARARREDREIVEITAPGLSQIDLTSLIEEAWQDAATRAHRAKP